MPMNLESFNLSALRIFNSAAHYLNFTKAAQSLNMTQSEVSQQIRLLEERIGFPLFIREARSLTLTEKGHILALSTDKIFAELMQTLQQLNQSDKALIMSCLPSFALQWLMPRLTEFHRKQPSVSVKLKAEFQELNKQSMLIDNIDIGIRFDPGQYTQVHAECILNEYLIPVASPEYLSNHSQFVNGQSIDNVTLLHDATPWVGAQEFIEWKVWMEKIKPEWLPALGGIQFNLSTLAITAALNHQGVAIGRAALVYDDIANGRLINIFNKPVLSPASYTLLSRSPQDKHVSLLSEWLKSECALFAQLRDKLIPIDSVIT